MNREQLAFAAERRVWLILINADDEVRGLEPSRVRQYASDRVDWLDTQLLGVSAAEQDEALESAATPDRDRAFGEAALAMRSTLSMIAAESELVS